MNLKNCTEEQTADESEGQCSETDLKRSFNHIRSTSTTFLRVNISLGIGH